MFCVFLYITNVCLGSGSLLNAALYKPAWMSSLMPQTTFPTLAEGANDESDDTNIYNGHCAHSNIDSPGWWMVDLRGLYMVEQIVLVNRGDDLVAAKRTQNFTFDVFQTDPRLSRDFPMAPGQVCYKRLEYVGQGETLTKNCTTRILGRFVRFIRYTLDALNFCEIKVLVSSAAYKENTFLARANYFLQVPPIVVTNTPNPLTRTSLCVQRRDSETCTAVNWVRTTTECQLLNVNTRRAISLSPNSSTVFYIET